MLFVATLESAKHHVDVHGDIVVCGISNRCTVKLWTSMKIICIWFIHDMGVIEKQNSVQVITLV
jgi:hypothetical protein